MADRLQLLHLILRLNWPTRKNRLMRLTFARGQAHGHIKLITGLSSVCMAGGVGYHAAAARLAQIHDAQRLLNVSKVAGRRHWSAAEWQLAARLPAGGGGPCAGCPP